MSVSSQPNSADSSNAAKPTRPDLAHSTGVADSGRWSTRRIAMYALFVALAMATSFISFPILPNPAFSFLKYDPAAAAIVSVLGFVPHVFMDPWGTLMAVLVALTLSVPAALIYRHVHTRKGAVIGLVVGALLALVAAIAGNLVITPIYTGWPVSEVAAIIVPALLPFNLIKFVIHGVVTFLVYKPISNLLNR